MEKFGKLSFSLWKLNKILLAMKLMTMLIFVCTIQLSASVYSQNTKLSIDVENQSLIDVFKEIRNNSEFTFVYDLEDVENVQNISASFDGSTVEEILDACLESTQLNYEIIDKVVVIKQKKKIAPKPETQQQPEKITITGKVTDEKEEPIPFVAIRVKGTNKGSTTADDGTYTIEVEDLKGVVLEISSLGYTTQEIPVNGRTQINVVLVDELEGLDEVVVYGTGLTKISKERATGSYSVMTGSEFESSPNNEIGASLEGNIVGLQQNYNPSTGRNEISIRGISTIGSNTAPLIVVNGFPVEGDFSTINPNDIESVTVLKDAAAASIWGARAGNGVIVVTTLKGKDNGKINVELNSFMQIGEEFDMDYNLPGASVNSYLTIDEYQVANNFGTGFGVPNDLSNGHLFYSKGRQAYFDYQQGNISKADLDRKIAQLREIDYRDDVKKYLLRRPISHQQSVLINGGTDKSNYALSVLYNDSKDQFKENDNQKVLVNLRNSYQIKDWLNLRFALMTEFKENDFSGADLGMIRRMSPYENLVNTDGTYAPLNHWVNRNVVDPVTRTAGGLGLPYKNWVYNPLQETLNRDYTIKYKNIRIQAGLDIKLLEGLIFTPSFQVEKFSTDTKRYDSEETFFTRYMVNNHIDYDRATNEVTTHYVPKGGILSQQFNETTSYDLRNQLTYDKLIAEDHEINLTTAVEHIWTKQEGYRDYTYGYDSDKNTFVNPPYGFGSNEVVMGHFVLPNDGYFGYIPSGKGFDYINRRVFSFFSNAAYTYKKKYTVTGSYRTDASNMIVDDPEFRYSPFWSVGGSWNAKFEPFLKDVEFVDKLIVRSTYGVSGNTIANASQVPVVSIRSTPSIRTGEATGSIIDQGNPTLRWEKVKSTNLAVEFSLFQRLLFGSLEVYNKQSEDLLANVSIAPTYGSSSQQLNAAEVSNKGFELSLNSNMKFGELTWKTGANIAYNKSEVNSLQVEFMGNSVTSARYVEGHEVAPTYSYVYGGMQDPNTPYIKGEDGVDFNFYEGFDGDGRDVLRNMGTQIPPTLVGWNNTISYKGFTFRALITGKFGHVFRRPTYKYDFSAITKPSLMHEDLDAILSGQADKMGLPNLPESFVNSTYRWSWYVPYLNSLVEKADHIRVKELYLGYDLSSNTCSKLGLSKLTLYAHARNLGTVWTANDKDIDPEYIKGSRINPGATYTLGFKLGF